MYDETKKEASYFELLGVDILQVITRCVQTTCKSNGMQVQSCLDYFPMENGMKIYSLMLRGNPCQKGRFDTPLVHNQLKVGVSCIELHVEILSELSCPLILGFALKTPHGT